MMEMQDQATSFNLPANSLPSSSERSSSSALHLDTKEGMESDDEIRRVPDLGVEAMGASAYGLGGGSAAGMVHQSATGSRKRGRSPADKESKRLKRLLRNRVSAQQARERKKAYLIDLETRVKELETKNAELEERLSTMQNENQMLRQDQEMKEAHSEANAIDYKGFPVDKSKTGGWIASALILGIELCERLSTMGIAVNLVTYLIGTMHLPSAASANIVTDFMGTSFLLCLVGGFLADSFLGRYKTITVFAIIQTFGTALLAIATKLPQLQPPPCPNTPCIQPTTLQMSALYTSLYLIAIGTGGIKSSVSGFGSDQFDENDKKERSHMILFFSRFFFFISLGSLFAVTVFVYIQDNVSRSLGYGICSVAMFVAIAVFLSGTKRYRYKKCWGSPIVQIMQVFTAAVKKKNVPVPENSGLLYEDTPEYGRIQHTDQFRFLDKAAVLTKENEAYIFSLQDPWTLSSVTKVEEVKMMIKLMPIWATTIIFWTTYAQMITFSVEQASTLQRSMGKFEIPSGSLTVFFVVAILFTLAVYDRLIVPFWKRWQGKPGFTSLQKIGIGLFLSILGMAAASLAEMKRLSTRSKTPSNIQTPLPLTVFVLIPQFFLIGSGEAFIYSGQLDFFITQSPKGMKTISTALFLSTISLGFFLSSLLVTVVEKVTTIGGGKGWVGHSIDDGRLDLFFGFLAVLSSVDFGVYLYCAGCYEKDLQMKSHVTPANSDVEKC